MHPAGAAQVLRRFPAGIERNGYLDEVDGLTADAVTRAYARMVEQADRVFVLSGRGRGGGAPAHGAVGPAPRPGGAARAIAMPAEEPRSLKNRCPPAGKLCMLFTPGEPFAPQDLSALRVAVALLGGTPTSRLFQNVREKQSLCYYCAASYTSLTGALCVDSGVEHANAAAARESILKELAALCAGPVEDGELADTKRALKNQLAAVGDTLQGLEGWYFAERMRGADKAPEQVAAEVDAVTADDVRRVLSSFRLSVCYTLTKEAGADA
ncbi:MAG: M16 family metallopeptidase [Ruthenibacterium lactatiformans]